MELKKKIFNFGSSAGFIIEQNVLKTMGLKEGDEIVAEIRKAGDKFDRDKEIKKLIKRTNFILNKLEKIKEKEIKELK